jgi:hypothetical protein
VRNVGCIPALLATRHPIVVLYFIINGATDPFSCFGDFSAEFDVIVVANPAGDEDSLRLVDRRSGAQFVLGTLTRPGGNSASTQSTFSLLGSGTHGMVSYEEGYTGTIDGRNIWGDYWLMQDGCGPRVEWTFSGEMSSELIETSAEEDASP